MIVSSGKYGFEAYGGKLLRKKDMAPWMNDPARTDPDGVGLELGAEVERAERGFFALLPTIRELRILNPSFAVNLTKADAELFKRNGVILRGAFDTAAEELASAHGLRFLHIDTELARAQARGGMGIDIITLRFNEDGGAYLHQECRGPGISAGSTGGGETSIDLPADFYLTMAAEDIAKLCWSSCYESMIANGVLAWLLEKARQKNGFALDFGIR